MKVFLIIAYINGYDGSLIEQEKQVRDMDICTRVSKFLNDWSTKKDRGYFTYCLERAE